MNEYSPERAGGGGVSGPAIMVPNASTLGSPAVTGAIPPAEGKLGRLFVTGAATGVGVLTGDFTVICGDLRGLFCKNLNYRTPHYLSVSSLYMNQQFIINPDHFLHSSTNNNSKATFIKKQIWQFCTQQIWDLLRLTRFPPALVCFEAMDSAMPNISIYHNFAKGKSKHVQQ